MRRRAAAEEEEVVAATPSEAEVVAHAKFEEGALTAVHASSDAVSITSRARQGLVCRTPRMLATVEPIAPSDPTESRAEVCAAEPAAAAPRWEDDYQAYSVSKLPPRRDRSMGRRPAQRVRVNAEPLPIESDLFVGEMAMLSRPTHSAELEASGYSTKWYFGGKTRSWEVRVQGRFKRKPEGALFVGIEIYDFCYDLQPSLSTYALERLVMPLFRRAVHPASLHFSRGSRPHQSEDPEALAIIAEGIGALDQLIDTPAGETPPELMSDLESHGLRKNAMPASEYRRRAEAITAALDTSTTYTFCVWGISRFANMLDWTACGVLPRPLPLSWSLYDWPTHLVCYELAAESSGRGSARSAAASGGTHRESRKRYVWDAMVWSRRSDNSAAIAANLAPIYDGIEERAPRILPTAASVSDGGHGDGDGDDGGGLAARHSSPRARAPDLVARLVKVTSPGAIAVTAPVEMASAEPSCAEAEHEEHEEADHVEVTSTPSTDALSW